MIFPTHDPSILRMDGLLGLLLHLPFFGTLLKRFILRVAVSKTRQYALPNQYFKAHVCPELVGRFSLADARESFRVLSQKTTISQIQNKFAELDNLSSPLTKIIDAIFKPN